MSANTTYIPALRFKSLTRFYDLAVDYLMQGKQLRRKSTEAIAKEHPEAILELACGTGGLTAAVILGMPDARILATDIDPDALNSANHKLQSYENISFMELDAFEAVHLSYDFDLVVSSLFMHHLTTDQKRDVFRRLASKMQRSAKLMIIDWGVPEGIFSHIGFFLVRMLDGFEVTRANHNGMLPKMIEDAGFVLSRSEILHQTLLGTVWIYCAKLERSERK